VSFNVIVQLKINLPPLSLSRANEAHLTFFSQDQRQAKRKDNRETDKFDFHAKELFWFGE
jgi:hypothetical protein